MAQEIINYGNTANDGTGDPLRDAFIKVDDNFTQIWAAGPVGSNITIQNNTVAVVNTNGNLILTPNGVGVIQTNSKLVPRLNNTYDLGSADLRYRSIFTGAGGINTTGNLTLGNISDLKIPGGVNGYVIQTDGAANLSWVALPGAGNGSPGGANTQVQFNDNGLFGGNATFAFNKATGNLNVPIITVGNRIVSNTGRFENYLFANAFQVGLGNTNNWDISGNIFSTPTGASWFSNVATLDDYISSAVDGYLNFQTYDATSNVATELHMQHGLVQINIYNGEFQQWEFSANGNLDAPGNITTSGNISGNYIFGDGSQLINLPGGVIQGNIPPASPDDTTLWWDDITGRLYVWYTDVDGSQWVDAAPAAPGATYGNATVSSYLASGNISTAIITTGIVKTGVFVTGNIPGASAVGAGARAFVTDADSVVFGNTYVGGAANSMPVVSNGTNWFIG